MFAASHIVFVDSTLPKLNALLAGLPSDVQVHVLPADRDGMGFMAQTLIGRSGIETLHLLCHGSPGQLHLGSITLGWADLTGYAAVIDMLSDTMLEDGQWLIYGCDVATGPEGRRFVQALRLMSGLDVAAASHKVGAVALGGNWTLDFAPPRLRRTLAVPQWPGVLFARVPCLIPTIRLLAQRG